MGVKLFRESGRYCYFQTIQEKQFISAHWHPHCWKSLQQTRILHPRNERKCDIMLVNVMRSYFHLITVYNFTNPNLILASRSWDSTLYYVFHLCSPPFIQDLWWKRKKKYLCHQSFEVYAAFLRRKRSRVWVSYPREWCRPNHLKKKKKNYYTVPCSKMLLGFVAFNQT